MAEDVCEIFGSAHMHVDPSRLGEIIMQLELDMQAGCLLGSLDASRQFPTVILASFSRVSGKESQGKAARHTCIQKIRITQPHLVLSTPHRTRSFACTFPSTPTFFEKSSRLLAESHVAKRPSTEPTNDQRGGPPKRRVGPGGGDGWLDHAPQEGPGITPEGRYLPSSKAKYEAASAALQRRRSMGGQKFYSNYGDGYHDESGFDKYGNQQVPITAWNQPGAPEFGAGAHDRGYSLPDNVTLVTLEEVDNGDVLLRLAHLYEEGEHRELSKPAYIDIRLLFQGCQITSACEMDLSATQFKGNLPDLVIELRPMQVRTFLMTLV